MKKRYQETIEDMYNENTIKHAQHFFDLLDFLKKSIYHEVLKVIFLNEHNVTLEEAALLIGIGLTTLKKYIKECKSILDYIQKKEL